MIHDALQASSNALNISVHITSYTRLQSNLKTTRIECQLTYDFPQEREVLLSLPDKHLSWLLVLHIYET